MSDYIRRADAVDAVAFGITIASAFNKETGERIDLFVKENDELRKAIRRIHDLPSADVAPVVRCRDCKHWQRGMIGMGCYWDADYPHEENDFCSRGDRREE